MTKRRNGIVEKTVSWPRWVEAQICSDARALPHLRAVQDAVIGQSVDRGYYLLLRPPLLHRAARKALDSAALAATSAQRTPRGVHVYIPSK